MSTFNDRYEQIERYLKGKMKGDELEIFETELTNNAELKDEVELHKASFKLLEQDYLMASSKLIRERIHQGPSQFINWKWFVALCGLALVIVAVVSGSDKKNETEDSQLRSEGVGELVELHKETSRKDPVKKSSLKAVRERHDALSELNAQVVEDRLETRDTVDSDGLRPKKLAEKEIITELPSSDGSFERKRGLLVQDKDDVLCDLSWIKPATNPTSLGDQDGEIILPIQPGLAYSVNEGDFETDPDLRYLGVGTYSIVAQDAAGCIYQLAPITITESPCLRAKDFSFNPLYENDFELRIKSSERTEITILNKIGQAVYEQEVEMEEMFEWDGTYTSGSQASIGLHKIIVSETNYAQCIYNLVITK